MTRCLDVLALLAALAGSATAGRITGMATSVQTGEPLASVELTLSPVRSPGSGEDRGRRGPPPRGTAARTALDGRFFFEGVEPGEYILAASKAGYEGGYRTPRRVTLTDASPNTSLRIELNRAPSIEGRVVDRDGDPIAEAQVELRAWSMSENQRVLNRVRSARTDDLGRYRIYNIMPGQYFLCLLPTTLSAMQGGVLHETLGVYFPQGSSPAEAAKLDLGWGQELEGVDLVATPADDTLVSGTVLETDGSPCGLCSVIVFDRTRIPAASTRLSDAGRFAIHGLAPGEYAFTARSPRGADLALERVYLAEGRPVELALRLTAGQPVSGRLVAAEADDSEPVAFDRAAIRLTPADGNLLGRPIGDRVSSEGAFEIATAPQGVYRVSASGLPENGYLRRVSLGSGELPGGKLRVTGDGPVVGVEVEIAFDGGAVQGQATGEDGESPAPPDGLVFLVPLDEGTALHPQVVGYGGTDGAFRFRGVAPGDYVTFASTRSATWDWSDPAVMADLERRASRLEVKGNGAVETTAPFLTSIGR